MGKQRIGHNGNTISDFEFADTHVEYMYEHFNIMLTAAGVKLSWIPGEEFLVLPDVVDRKTY